MCATEDPQLLEETCEHILTKARDQDVIYYIAGLAANYKARRQLTRFFKENYDNVSRDAKTGNTV
jgi:aminopeptidase 2